MAYLLKAEPRPLTLWEAYRREMERLEIMLRARSWNSDLQRKLKVDRMTAASADRAREQARSS